MLVLKEKEGSSRSMLVTREHEGLHAILEILRKEEQE